MAAQPQERVPSTASVRKILGRQSLTDMESHQEIMLIMWQSMIAMKILTPPRVNLLCKNVCFEACHIIYTCILYVCYTFTMGMWRSPITASRSDHRQPSLSEGMVILFSFNKI